MFQCTFGRVADQPARVADLVHHRVAGVDAGRTGDALVLQAVPNIDACDSVMDKMNYPRGLVRYTTEHGLKHEATRVIRPRTLVYATLLTVLIGGLITAMATRTPVILDVIRDRNSLYRELPNGIIENIYTLKLINQSNSPRSFRLAVTGFEGISLDGAGEQVTVEGGGVLSLPVRVRAERETAIGIHKIDFVVTASDDASVSVTEDSRFLGPTP